MVTVSCVSIQNDSILNHSTSVSHGIAVHAEKDYSRLTLYKSLQRNALIGGFKWLAKNEIAHSTNFESILQLCKSLSCDYLNELHVGGNAKYTSHESTFEFVDMLSKCGESDIMNEIQHSYFVSVMCNETTNISITKQLIVYVCYVVDGEVKVHCLKIKYLQNGTAATIEQDLLSVCQMTGIDLSKIVGLGSDGANVMIRNRTEVAVRIKEQYAVIASIHCVPHRLAQAAGQVSGSVPYLKKFKKYLSQLFYYYHNSAVRSASLKCMQEFLDDLVLKIKKAGDTRWLSHDQAVKSICCVLPSLTADLVRESEERSDANALGLSHLVKTYSFVASIYLLSDILPTLSKLSLVFKRKMSISLQFKLMFQIQLKC